MRQGKLIDLCVCMLALLTLTTCVKPIEFDVPPPQSLLVIEGMINNSPGPYTVQITKALPLNTDSIYRPPVQGAQVRLYDDQSNIENFQEVSPGVYKTGGAMQGEIGRSYHIKVEMEDGSIFESEPDLMKPVGEVQAIRFEYEERVSEEFFGEVRNDVFNVFVDSDAGSGQGNYVRWKFKGTYFVTTNPELRQYILPYSVDPLVDPPECSGYIPIVAPSGRGTVTLKVGDCTCCECWVDQFEPAPQLSDDLLVEDSEFKNVKVAEVPINSRTFHEKYRVEIEQMSLTQTAFEFFKLVGIQKEEASSIFQPPSGEIVGNIKPVNSEDAVVGLFWATATTKKHIFIQKEDVPYLLAPYDPIPESCPLFFKNSTLEKPEGWD